MLGFTEKQYYDWLKCDDQLIFFHKVLAARKAALTRVISPGFDGVVLYKAKVICDGYIPGLSGSFSDPKSFSDLEDYYAWYVVSLKKLNDGKDSNVEEMAIKYTACLRLEDRAKMFLEVLKRLLSQVSVRGSIEADILKVNSFPESILSIGQRQRFIDEKLKGDYVVDMIRRLERSQRQAIFDDMDIPRPKYESYAYRTLMNATVGKAYPSGPANDRHKAFWNFQITWPEIAGKSMEEQLRIIEAKRDRPCCPHLEMQIANVAIKAMKEQIALDKFRTERKARRESGEYLRKRCDFCGYTARCSTCVSRARDPDMVAEDREEHSDDDE